jgi:hypothetical protein
MRQWVFVIRDEEIVFKKRIKQKMWPLYRGTKFQTFLEIGDKIVFYQAGLGGQIFLGTAEVKSEVKQIPKKIDSYIDLDKINIWKKHPSIRNMVAKLSFIKNKEHWGLYLQGGILRMEKKDYTTIINAAKELEVKKK